MHHLVRTIVPFVALIAPLAIGNQALADKRLSEVTIEVDDWTLTPIIEEQNGVAFVHSFVALRDATMSQGANITTVWFVRGHTPAGKPQWEVSAWLTQDQWESIAYIKAALDIPDADDEIWPTKMPKPEVMSTSPEAPKEFSKGVTAEDPILPIINGSTSPDFVVSSLVQIGYPAAGISITTPFVPDQCRHDFVEAYALGIESEEADQGQTPGIGQAAIDNYLALANCTSASCDKSKVNGRWSVWSTWSTPSAWSCGRVYQPILSNVRYCEYWRTRSQTRTRTVTLKNSDCTTSTCTQTETKTQKDVSTCDHQVTDGPTCANCPSASVCDANAAFENDESSSNIAPPCEPY